MIHRARCRILQCLLALLVTGSAALPSAAAPQEPSRSTEAAAAERAAEAETAEVAARGFLGFHFAYRASLEVLEVLALYPEGPAEKAGLRVGDRVTEVNGVRFRFTSELELNEAFDWIRPGETVELTVERGGGVETLALVASELPESIRRRKDEKREVLRQIEGNETLARLLAGDGELIFEKLADGTLRATAEGIEGSVDEEALGLLRRRHTDVDQRLGAMRPGDRLRLRITQDPGAGVTIRWARPQSAGEGD